MINTSRELTEIVEKELNNIEPISKNMERFLKMRIVVFFVIIVSSILSFTIEFFQKQVSKKIKESESYFFLEEKFSIFLSDKIQEFLAETLRKIENKKDLTNEKKIISFIYIVNTDKIKKEKEDFQTIYRTYIQSNKLEGKKKIDKEWDNLKEEYFNFILKNKIRIHSDLEKTINNFEFRAFYYESLPITNKDHSFENSFIDSFQKIDKQSNEITNLNFKKSLSYLYSSIYNKPLNFSGFIYKGSLDPDNEDFQNALKNLRQTLNVNQKEFEENLEELINILNTDFINTTDQDIIVLKKLFNEKNLLQELYDMEICNNLVHKCDVYICAMKEKLKAILTENSNFKFYTTKQLAENLYPTSKTKINNIFTVCDLIFFIPLIPEVMLLISIFKLKKEMKYYKLLIFITIISIIVDLIEIIHILVRIASYYLPSIAWFIYKINIKNKFYPWIFFRNSCLQICNFCIFSLTLIIYSRTVFPFLISIFSQKVKTKIICSKKITFILLTIIIIIQFYNIISFTISMIEQMNDYFANKI